MTKQRAPMSIENTLRIVVGQLEDRAAAVTGRQQSYLAECTDESKPQLLTVRDMELLDLEHHAQFGRGFPIFEALGRRLDSARAERFVDEAAIARAAIEHARESGEASAALIAATLPSNNSVETLTNALRELEQSDAATGAAISIVREALARARDAPNDTS